MKWYMEEDEYERAEDEEKEDDGYYLEIKVCSFECLQSMWYVVWGGGLDKGLEIWTFVAFFAPRRARDGNCLKAAMRLDRLSDLITVFKRFPSPVLLDGKNDASTPYLSIQLN